MTKSDKPFTNLTSDSTDAFMDEAVARVSQTDSATDSVIDPDAKQFDELGRVIRRNREAEKRERDALRDLAKEMLGLAKPIYEQLPIDERLKAALIEGKRLKDNALRRHLSFVARLILEQGGEAIQAAVDKVNFPNRNDVEKLRLIAQLQQRVISGDKAIFAELLERFADVDLQYLRQLARNIDKEQQKRAQINLDRVANGQREDNKSTKSEKVLQRYLSQLQLG